MPASAPPPKRSASCPMPLPNAVLEGVGLPSSKRFLHRLIIAGQNLEHFGVQGGADHFAAQAPRRDGSDSRPAGSSSVRSGWYRDRTARVAPPASAGSSLVVTSSSSFAMARLVQIPIAIHAAGVDDHHIVVVPRVVQNRARDPAGPGRLRPSTPAPAAHRRRSPG